MLGCIAYSRADGEPSITHQNLTPSVEDQAQASENALCAFQRALEPAFRFAVDAQRRIALSAVHLAIVDAATTTKLMPKTTTLSTKSAGPSTRPRARLN